MPLQIIKQLAVEEDIVWGIGTVVQPRDTNGDGVQEDITYNKVNTSSIPHLQTDGITVSDAETEINNRYTKDESDTKFAKINGDISQIFNVAIPTSSTEAVPRGYLETYMSDQLAEYALKTEVLTKTNLVSYTPTSSYHPATKQYVDDTVVAIGAGDMAKAIYDNSGTDGIVDNAEALNGFKETEFMRYVGVALDCNATSEIGYYYMTAGINAPTVDEGQLTVKNDEHGNIVQTYHVISNDEVFSRSYNGTDWNPWVSSFSQVTVQNDLLGNTDLSVALSADQGRVLADQISVVSTTVAPVGAILMYSGTYSSIPANWSICDGTDGTPDLRNRFIQGAGTEGDMHTTGGSTEATMPAHTHLMPNHTHTINHDHPVDTTSAAGAHYHQAQGDHYSLNTGGTGQSYGLQKNDGYQNTSSNGSHSHTYSVEDHIGSSGAGGYGLTEMSASEGSDNRPLFYTLAYIQRKS